MRSITRGPLGQLERCNSPRQSPGRPQLRFSPTAWAKLLYFRDRGDLEIGGFGISAAHDLLLVHDFALIRQVNSLVTVEFEDLAVAEYFDQQIDARKRPDQFARIWIHTHPSKSATPSEVDEATFTRVFGRSDWSVMAIVAHGGQTYARLRVTAGPGCERTVSLTVDFQVPFAAADHHAWNAEYLSCIQSLPDHLYQEPTRAQSLPGATVLRRELTTLECTQWPEW